MRIFGLILFVWMAAAIIGGVREMRVASGSPLKLYIAFTAVLAILAALGLTMALGKKVRFSLRVLMGSVTLCALCLGLWSSWNYIPGTIRLDDHGFAHGTGTLRYIYDSGVLQVEDHYFNGLITRKVWYRPDGAIAVTSDFGKQQGGMFYTLRVDGTIETKVPFTYSPDDGDYIANGPMIYYTLDGGIDHTVDYRDGRPVSSDSNESTPASDVH